MHTPFAVQLQTRMALGGQDLRGATLGLLCFAPRLGSLGLWLVVIGVKLATDLHAFALFAAHEAFAPSCSFL